MKLNDKFINFEHFLEASEYIECWHQKQEKSPFFAELIAIDLYYVQG